MKSAIAIEGLSYAYGKADVLKQVRFSVDREDFFIIIGPNGSGKTTLMKLMAGLEKPTTGEIWHDGENVTGVAVQKRSVAMVYQAFINYPSFSVYDNIALKGVQNQRQP